MTSLSSPAPRVKGSRPKPPRSVKLLCLPPEGKGTLRIIEGKRSDLYYFRALPSDFGRAFEMAKVGGDTYAVNLDGQASTCDCKGFGRWSHCRHVESLTALIAAGKLAPSTNGRA
jgi:hypothetical protein